MNTNDYNQKEIFTATSVNPNHEYVFDESNFRNVTSRNSGFIIIRPNKIETRLNDRSVKLMVNVFVSNQLIATDYFDFLKGNKEVIFYQAYLGESETGFFGFKMKE